MKYIGYSLIILGLIFLESCGRKGEIQRLEELSKEKEKSLTIICDSFLKEPNIAYLRIESSYKGYEGDNNPHDGVNNWNFLYLDWSNRDSFGKTIYLKRLEDVLSREKIDRKKYDFYRIFLESNQLMGIGRPWQKKCTNCVELEYLNNGLHYSKDTNHNLDDDGYYYDLKKVSPHWILYSHK